VRKMRRGRCIFSAILKAGEENAEGTVYIFRYFEDEEGNPSLENIQSDEEFEAVEERFDELLDEAEFEEE